MQHTKHTFQQVPRETLPAWYGIQSFIGLVVFMAVITFIYAIA